MQRPSSMPINIEKRPKSALLRGVRITEFDNHLINPDPIVLEDTDFLLEEFLSPNKLKALTGVDDLYSVDNLEMIVDTSETSLGNFGIYLPNLKQLKLNSSVIPKVRDLGTSLSHLRILWMTRSCLYDLDGLPAFTSLEELYLAFNEISDLSPCSMLDNLKVLDLEGNLISDIRQIEFLSLCTNLKNLTLEGNPICIKSNPETKESKSYNYRNEVFKMLTNIEILDNIPKSNAKKEKVENTTDNQAYFDNDWNAINQWIEEGIGPPEEKLAFNESRRPLSSSTKGESPVNYLRPLSAMRPLSSCRPGSALSKRPGTGSRKSSPAQTTQFLTDEQLEDLSNDSSKLTMGPVLQGNPFRGLLARRKNKNVSEGAQAETRIEPTSKANVSKNLKTEPLQNSELLSELSTWRKEHEMKIQERKKYFEPQILKIEDDNNIESFDIEDNNIEENDDDLPYEEYNQTIDKHRSIYTSDSLSALAAPYTLSTEPNSRIPTSDTGYASLSESRASFKKEASLLKSPSQQSTESINNQQQPVIISSKKITSPNLSQSQSTLTQLRKNLLPLSGLKFPKN